MPYRCYRMICLRDDGWDCDLVRVDPSQTKGHGVGELSWYPSYATLIHCFSKRLKFRSYPEGSRFGIFGA